ncbi:predicted protein [Sclerotinia sclerotiorum 1980 UF-70]|uniref:Uncharacterized protein n=1 Tax=Sclerotinia sclerotiorum (strain ATCC 18683 / 1980 / Ss-1) TaxID=665079 RepID=A7EGE2_SCLS1|nr:predicted protein [Sclerotinia sclerotiorum 1980 UF-70]EDO01908.1 predicted protein [Sclerotinia sclerotiorum 1980 UF-70]
MSNKHLSWPKENPSFILHKTRHWVTPASNLQEQRHSYYVKTLQERSPDLACWKDNSPLELGSIDGQSGKRTACIEDLGIRKIIDDGTCE